MSVEKGKKVSIEYTLTVDGAVADSNKGGEPLSYMHGENQIVPGLEKQLDGMNVGDSKTVTVEADQGYGELQADAIMEVPKDQVPEEAHQVGAQLMTKDSQGNVLRPTVAEVKDEVVVLDFNHPLAGKTLTFEVQIVGIE